MSEQRGDQWTVKFVINESRFGHIVLERPGEYLFHFNPDYREDIETIASWLNRDERELRALRAELQAFSDWLFEMEVQQKNLMKTGGSARTRDAARMTMETIQRITLRFREALPEQESEGE